MRSAGETPAPQEPTERQHCPICDMPLVCVTCEADAGLRVKLSPLEAEHTRLRRALEWAERERTRLVRSAMTR